jgi:predicted transcriptional regulator
VAKMTLRVPDELYRELERLSSQAGVSKSDLAHEALRRYLQLAGLKSLRARLEPLDQDQGVHTDGDVLRRLGKR